jgi:hypothetical protein
MPTTRKLTIMAQDPSVKDATGKILKTQVSIPYEKLGPGPRGYRVHVVDYDASQRVLYKQFDLGDDVDLFKNVPDSRLCKDTAFHAQNVYAIVMRLLARFEAALGRRISWSFGGHQIHVVPHAFADANAYYSDDAHGLFFGYFPASDGKPVYTCLSHDVITHEATHALLDGIRESYTLPSDPDQAGFHEGYADIVALLSVFGLRDVVRSLLPGVDPSGNYVKKKELQDGNKLRQSVLLGLAEQFGQEASRYRQNCLRRAVDRRPRKDALKDIGFKEAHIRGEILSSAVLNSFIDTWMARLRTWLPKKDEFVPIERVVEDGVDAADHLLTMCIRALDYCPVVDITFAEFLSALLTADLRLLPDDGTYKYRGILRKQFDSWGISPASGTQEELDKGEVPELGVWKSSEGTQLDYSCVHRESLERNYDEVFRFLWENRKALEIYEDAYTWVISLRPCVRIAPDGFILKETVGEYRQTLDITANQLASVGEGIDKPDGMPDDTQVRLNGGGVLVFDEFGYLKYHIHSRIDNEQRQGKRLKYLWENGVFDRFKQYKRYGFSDGSPVGQRFALMHNRRDGITMKGDEWK